MSLDVNSLIIASLVVSQVFTWRALAIQNRRNKISEQLFEELGKATGALKADGPA